MTTTLTKAQSDKLRTKMVHGDGMAFEKFIKANGQYDIPSGSARNAFGDYKNHRLKRHDNIEIAIRAFILWKENAASRNRENIWNANRLTTAK